MASKKRLEEVLQLRIKEVLLLYALKEYGPIGRGRLTSVLNLPEGVIRGLLTKLQRMQQVSADRLGCMVTESGEKQLGRRLSELQIRAVKGYEGAKLSVGPVSVAVHIGGAAGKVRLGIEERDACIKAGARGAVTLTYKAGVLSMPGICESLAEYNPNIAEELMSVFDLKDGDLILIVFAGDYWRSLDGALSAASALAGRSAPP